MQVNSSNGSLQQRFFSGTGSIGGIHLPDFNDKYIFSKKKSGVSDKEYRKQIREQAYEDFEKGQFQNKSEGFNRLMKSYTSEVSPDRKGIITSGLKAISRNRQNVLKPIDFVATLLNVIDTVVSFKFYDNILFKELHRLHFQFNIFPSSFNDTLF